MNMNAPRLLHSTRPKPNDLPPAQNKAHPFVAKAFQEMGLSIFQSLGLLLHQCPTHWTLLTSTLTVSQQMANFSVVRSLCQLPHQHTWDGQAVKMFWPSWVIVQWSVLDKIISNFASHLQSLN